MVIGDHLLDMLDGGVDQYAFHRGQHIGEAGGDDQFETGLFLDILNRLGEDIHAQKGFGTRIVKLMDHLRFGIQGIGIDDTQSRPQGTKYGDGVLQGIEHLNGDSITRDE